MNIELALSRRRRRTKAPGQFHPRPEKLAPLDRQCLALGATFALAWERVAHGHAVLSNLDDPIAQILGWPETAVGRLTTERDPKVRRALRARLAELTRPDLPPHALLEANLATLSTRLGLTEAETAVLRVAASLELHRVMFQVADSIYTSSPQQLRDLSSAATGLTPAAIDRALCEDSALFRTGLLDVRKMRQRHSDLEDRLDLLDGLATQLVEIDFSRHGVSTPHISPMAAAKLQLAQYPHLRKEAELISRILKAALAERRAGVNILLYGPPGTGKTELARAAVTAIGGQGFEMRASCRISIGCSESAG